MQCPKVGTNGTLFCYKSNKYNEFWSTDTENRPNVYVPLPGLSLFHTDTQAPVVFSHGVGGIAHRDLAGNRAKVAGICTRVLAVAGQWTWQGWSGSWEVPRGIWGLGRKSWGSASPSESNLVKFCDIWDIFCSGPNLHPIKALLFTWAALQALGLTLQPWPQE